MAESTYEQIAAAVRTRLSGISGDNGTTYWYTPSTVVRAPAFTQDILDPTYQTVYAVIPGEERFEEETITTTRGTMELDVALCARYAPATENPHRAPSPTRWLVQNRMLQDAIKRLRTDLTVGGLALHLAIISAERGAEETYIEGWAVAFLRIEITYTFTDGTP